MAELSKSENVLVVQARVIAALMLRETRTTFGGAQFGYLWAIVNPALGTAVLVIIFSLVSRHPPIGTSFALFFATGLLLFEMNRKLSSSLMNVFDANKGLLAYPLVKEGDVIFARFALIFATYLLVMIVFFGGLIAIGEAFFPAQLDEVMLAILVTALLGLGGGVTNAVIVRLWSTWRQLESILGKPLFFISGIFFIPSSFPPEIRDILAWNPLLHCIEWMREGYYPNYESIILDKGFVFMCIGILMVTGLGGERLYRKHAS